MQAEGLDIVNMRKFMASSQIKGISDVIKNATATYTKYQRAYKMPI